MTTGAVYVGASTAGNYTISSAVGMEKFSSNVFVNQIGTAMLFGGINVGTLAALSTLYFSVKPLTTLFYVPKLVFVSHLSLQCTKNFLNNLSLYKLHKLCS